MHSAVRGCLKECRRFLQASLSRQSEALLATPVTYPLDLKASHTTREYASLIQEMLRVHNVALSGMPSDKADDFHIDAVLGNIIQPLLQSCRMGAASLQPAEMATFLLNNISLIQQEIAEDCKMFERAGTGAGGDQSQSQSQSGDADADAHAPVTWLQLLQSETVTWVDILIREEVGRALRR